MIVSLITPNDHWMSLFVSDDVLGPGICPALSFPVTSSHRSCLQPTLARVRLWAPQLHTLRSHHTRVKSLNTRVTQQKSIEISALTLTHQRNPLKRTLKGNLTMQCFTKPQIKKSEYSKVIADF